MNRKPEKNPAARAYFRAFYRGNRLRCAAAISPEKAQRRSSRSLPMSWSRGGPPA